MTAASALPLRVIDTGIRSGRANIAFDQALIEAHAANRITVPVAPVAQTMRVER